MIMPLVFFMNPSDPRFLSTLKAVLKSPERGGLTTNASSFQYLTQLRRLTRHLPRASCIDTTSQKPTTGSEVKREHSVCAPYGKPGICAPSAQPHLPGRFANRAIEALTRAGEYDKGMLSKAVTMFEDFLQYLNHVGLCTEEISTSGEGLGNAVQGFT